MASKAGENLDRLLGRWVVRDEIVEVEYARARKGDRVLWFFDNYVISDPDLDHIEEEWRYTLTVYDALGDPVSTKDPAQDGGFVDVPEDWWGMSFSFAGWSFGLDRVSSLEPDDEVFQEWTEELKHYGDLLLDEAQALGRQDCDTVTFLVLIEYRSREDREGQIHGQWTLLGPLDQNKLRLALADSARKEIEGAE